jgi:serine protease AprX
MAIEIPSSLVEFILLGPTDDRRQLQDSPILGDVWVAFATRPDACLDLLITPRMTLPAGQVADAIEQRLDRLVKRSRGDEDPNIAYLQGIVATRLYFEELLRVVIPLTQWWDDRRIRDEKGKLIGHELLHYGPERQGTEKTTRAVQAALHAAKKQFARNAPTAKLDKNQFPYELMPLDRYVVLAGLILWGRGQTTRAKRTVLTPSEKVEEVLKKATAKAVMEGLRTLFRKISNDVERKDVRSDPIAWQVSLNRTATAALTKSIPAVKADAARFLFKVDCSAISWAVIDSGIDGTHPAFGKTDSAELRIKKSFDFRNFRKIVSLSNSREEIRKRNLKEVLELDGLMINRLGADKKSNEELEADLKTLAQDAKRRASIHWDLVEQFVEIDPKTRPDTNHGTHVAGILGGSKDAAERGVPVGKNADLADGMCPDINLYDFRVLGPSMSDTEFAIIAVLQYIRYINDRDNYFSIHGVNLSLSIPHDVRNFACGSTPICTECERLSNSGVIVVAAAGNHGHKSFETKEGAYEGYAAFSITDPGNAEDVITVGATHRNWPHTYGVSFFSSRGPTGDGRLKPDLVAPGERIRAPLPDRLWGDLDGTSMAAPHVSGAAAMLLSRYSELIGHPSRVKRILCETATDLGRERTFQGHGMLDVLRAFQSI